MAKRAELAEWLGREQPREIGETQWDALLAALAPVSENYLRKLVRECGVALAPLVEGVRQESLDSLEASLLKMLEEYESSDRVRRSRIRKLVISAKDHARWASKKDTKRAEKEEMMLWMLTWLENPPLFRDWVRLRRAAVVARPASEAPHAG